MVEENKSSADNFTVKTPWGKLVQLQGLEYLLESFMKDIENQNKIIKKLQDEVKKLKHLEMSINETKDNSILTKRAVKRLINKFDDEETFKSKVNLVDKDIPDLKQAVENLTVELVNVKDEQEQIVSQIKKVAETQEKHAKRLDAVFESLISLMDKIDRIQSKTTSSSLDKVLESALEQDLSEKKEDST